MKLNREGRSVDVKTAFATVLRCALQEEKLPAVDESLWQPLLELAHAQHLFSIISEKLAELPAFCASALYDAALRRNVQHSMQQSQKDAAFFGLYRAMEEAGLRPLVLKGPVCRQAYGTLGNLRPSGDEDLMVPPADFARAWQVLEEQGYIPLKKLQDVDANTVHHELFHHESGHRIELHVHPIGVINSVLQRMDAYFDNAFERAVSVELPGSRVYTLCPTDHYLLLIFHAAKHFCGGGFGIRLLTDVAMFYRSQAKEIDMARVEEAMCACRLEGLYADMVYLANEKLGFALPEPGKTVCPQVLLDHMLESGVFGESNMTAALANTVTFSSIRHGSGTGKAFWKLVFPPKNQVELLHPELRNRPLKLLLYYPKRWLKATRMVLGVRGTSPVRSLVDSHKRLKLLKRYGIQ